MTVHELYVDKSKFYTIEVQGVTVKSQPLPGKALEDFHTYRQRETCVTLYESSHDTTERRMLACQANGEEWANTELLNDLGLSMLLWRQGRLF